VEELDGAVEVVRLPAIVKIGAVAVCPGFPAQLAREDADLIVLHEPNPIALVAYFLVRPSARLIVWFHSDVIRPSWRYRLFYRPFLRFALKSAARIVVSSAPLKETAPALREWRAKCMVIPFGVERPVESASVAARAEEIRREMKQPFALFVGRLVGYKGVDVLIDALRHSSAAAVIVGDGPLKGALEAQAHAAGIFDRVRFAGQVSNDELAALYRACDLFVLNSSYEGFPHVILEAMSAGLPVVATAVGGTPELVEHGVSGILIPSNGQVALTRALMHLLSCDEERRRLAAGAQSLLRRFQSAEMIRRTESILVACSSVGRMQAQIEPTA